MKIAVYKCTHPTCDALDKEVRKDAEVERERLQFCNVCGHNLRWLRQEEPTKTIPRVLAIRDSINLRFARTLHVTAGVTVGEVMDGFYEMADAIPQLVEALECAEGFISGFEDDEMQTGMTTLLLCIRTAIKLGGSFQ
jgi:hypothetical protein